MNAEIVRRRAAEWMIARGWRQKLAKGRPHEQSLFEHSLIEVDVLLELLPILASPGHYGLSEAEERILAVAVLVHDVGKEPGPWQAYIRDPRLDRWVPHVIPEVTRDVVPEICAKLGLEDLGESVRRIMAHCAEFHHSRPGRSDGAILEAMLAGESDRFLTLAHLVKAVDHSCSAASAREAAETVESDPSPGKHLLVTSHEAMVRGVSTTFLHRASQAAFQQPPCAGTVLLFDIGERNYHTPLFLNKRKAISASARLRRPSRSEAFRHTGRTADLSSHLRMLP